MARRLLHFRWHMPRNGHEWIDGPLVTGDSVADEASPIMVAKLTNREADLRLYEPLHRETGLFREFASLPVDKAGVLAFADQYGPLAERDLVLAKGGKYSLAAVKSSGRKIPVRRGDTLARWTNSILTMTACVTLWEKARAGDREFLASAIVTVPRQENPEYVSSLVQVSQDGAFVPAAQYYVPPLSGGITANVGGKRVPLGAPSGLYVAHAAGPAKAPATLSTGDRVAFAIPAGGREKKRLGGFGVTYPRAGADFDDAVGLAKALVTSEIGRNLSQGVSPVVVPNPRLGWGELRFVPGTLVDALWLQFAEAVCGDKVYRECAVCKKPFEISPDVARTNRTLCSGSCKARAYRRRKARACRLWASGRTINGIVKETGSDAEQVKKWIAMHLHGEGRPVAEIARELGTSTTRLRSSILKKGAK